MVTIVDVARMAGVSTATVSHSFSAKRPVSRQTRERVLAVAERAGYRPSHVAASMVTGRTRTIGMVVPDIANPFFSELVRGAEAAAMAAGYMTIVCSSELDAALEDRCVAVLGDKRHRHHLDRHIRALGHKSFCRVTPSTGRNHCFELFHEIVRQRIPCIVDHKRRFVERQLRNR